MRTFSQEYRRQQRIDEIKSVWEPGMSAADIAAAVSWKPSRNSIIGMFSRHADRLAPCTLTSHNGKGALRHGTTAKRKTKAATITLSKPVKRAKAKLVQKPKPTPASINEDINTAEDAEVIEETKDEVVVELGPSRATEEDYIDTPENFLCVSVLDHKEGQCRWPSDGVTNITYCGCPVSGNSVYCERHVRRGTKVAKVFTKNKKVWRDERRR